jgi:hypothetical protein
MAVSKIASIIAKKRLADIAKKKVAKIPRGEAREVAKEARKPIGGMSALKRSGGTIPTRPTKVPRDLSVKKITPPPGKRSIYQERINRAVREGTGVPERKGKKYTGPINPPGPKNRPAGLKSISKIEEREPRPKPLSKLETSILREVGKRDYNTGGVNPLAFKVQQQEADRRVIKALREIKTAEKKVKQVEKRNRRSR